MADGSVTIPLDDDTARRLAAAAEQAGESPDAFASRLLIRALEHDSWTISHARLDEYDRTGEAKEAGPVLERFLSNLRVRAAAKLSHQERATSSFSHPARKAI